MIKLNTLLGILFLAIIGHSQTIIYNNQFESASSDWIKIGDLTTNTWVNKSCAGNGPSFAGASAMYVSNPGAVPGCGANGDIRYTYANGTNASESNLIYTVINSNCTNGLTLTYDYRIGGVSTEDYAELVYSTDNGGSWVVLGGEIVNQATWTSASVTLPSLLDNTTFWIGFRFTYSNANVVGAPMAFDNFKIVSATITDAQAPTFTCPSAQNIYLNSTCQINVLNYTIGLVGLADNCASNSQLTLSQDVSTGLTSATAGQIIPVTITATDLNTNSNSCTFNLTVIDSIKPTIICPSSLSAFADATCNYVIADYSGNVTTTDNCSTALTITQSPVIGSSASGTTAITMTVTDASANTKSCVFSLLSNDTIKPIFNCLADSTVKVISGCNYPMSDFTNEINLVSDNCTATPSILLGQSVSVGTNLTLGTHPITLTAIDLAGNSKTCAFNLIVEDQTNPTILCPPNQQIYAPSANCDVVLGDYKSLASAMDNCTFASSLVFTQSPASGTTISTNTIVTMQVQDQSGNTAGCTFLVNVTDTVSPTLSCPPSSNVTINASCGYNVPDLTGLVTFSDNCTPSNAMVFTQLPPATSIASGTTAILITVADAQGNDKSCVLNLIPIDTQAPTIICPSNQNINNASNCDFTLGSYASLASVLDNCAGYTVTQTPLAGVVVPTGTHAINLTVTDVSGNTASCAFQLSVKENVIPTISCPANISTCNPLVNYTLPTYSDNCLVKLIQTDGTGFTNGFTFPVGITNQTWMAIDSSGNQATCSFTVEVKEFPSNAIIPVDSILLCNNSSVLLAADPIVSGQGQWTVLSGTGTINNANANQTGVNNLGFGTNIFKWEVSTAACGVKSDTVFVVVYQQPPLASTQDTLIACSEPKVLLLANNPSVGIGTWTTNNGAIITDVNDASTVANFVNGGWNDFIWTITNGNCPASQDTFHVYATPKANIFESDTSLCVENTFLSFTGNVPLAGDSSYWSIGLGDGTLINPYNDTVTLSVLKPGTIYLIYNMVNPICLTNKDTVIITGLVCYDESVELPNLITPNYDGKNDVFFINNLEKIHPELEVTIFNRWGSVVYESIGYAHPWEGTYKEERLPFGTYYYNIKLNDDKNTIIKGSVSIIE